MQERSNSRNAQTFKPTFGEINQPSSNWVPLARTRLLEMRGDKSQSKAELRDSGAFYEPTGILQVAEISCYQRQRRPIKQDALEMSRMFDLGNSKD